MEETIKKITVFGGTGMLGRPVVRELVRAGYDVAAMVRDAGRAASKLPEKVALVEGDLASRKDIAAALNGADAVYLNLSTRPDVRKYEKFIAERDGLENVLAVAAQINSAAGSGSGAGVAGNRGPKDGSESSAGTKIVRDDRPAGPIKRVAAISSMVHRYQGTAGFRWWAFEIKQWAEKLLREADVPVTIFYPSSFMETLDKGGIMQGHRLMLVGKSRRPMHFIAGEDYGRMVAEAFRRHDGIDQFYDIQGPAAFTLDEAALEFVRNYRHGPLKITRVPMWLIKAMGAVNAEVNYLARIMEALNNYQEPEPDASVWKKLGHPRLTLAEYARRL